MHRLTLTFKEAEFIGGWIMHEADVAHERDYDQDMLPPLYSVADRMKSYLIDDNRPIVPGKGHVTMKLTPGEFDWFVDITNWRYEVAHLPAFCDDADYDEERQLLVKLIEKTELD